MAIALGVAATIAVPSLAVARGDDDIERFGTCTGNTASEIKLSDEDGRIEVEFEVDQNRNGVPWRVVITRNGSRVFSGVRTTRGPSGSFEVRRVLRNGRGAEVIRARATSPSGEVCRASATWRR
jgi:hypothetical protein